MVDYLLLLASVVFVEVKEASVVLWSELIVEKCLQDWMKLD